jgi:hypothetical protein
VLTTPVPTSVTTPVSPATDTPEPAGLAPTVQLTSPDPTLPPPTAPASTSPSAITLRQPLLVDGERGRLYAAGQVNAEPATIALSTVDGQLLARYAPSGELALDRDRDLLVIDDGRTGLSILSAATGELLAKVDLPAQEHVPQPHVDPTTGLIYAFRDHLVYIVDPDAGAVVRITEPDVASTVCGDPAGPARISRSHYDLLSRRLYLVFITYVCTPWTAATVVGYDVPELASFGRFETDPNYQAEAFQGSLFGVTRPRLGPNQYWAWSGGEPWYSASGDDSLALRGMATDWGRGLVYEAVGQQVDVIDPASHLTVRQVTVPLLSDGYLVAHDPITDQLYFLGGTGRLYIIPAATLFEHGRPPQPAPSELPARPVFALRVSPGWPQDPFLAGLWENAECPIAGGSLFVRPNQEAGWMYVPITQDPQCDSLADLVLSPDFAQDRTLVVADNNLQTVLRSSDGGATWQDSVTPFPTGTRFESLLISSGYRSDGTLFAHTTSDQIYRSRDHGRTWVLLDVLLTQITISREFGDDHTLMGADGTSLLISRDGGDTWAPLGPTPNGERLLVLSLAPLYDRWHVVFAFTAGGSLYRSLDGGENWEYKMTVADRGTAQIVYAPDIDEYRPVFLLHGSSLDVSYDGWESTWGLGPRFQVPSTEFTSLAISPRFADAGLLFLGTADGQVISADASPPR